MKQSTPVLWAMGWGGAILGASLAGFALVTGGELANLIGGYGLMTLGSALYLLAGLKLRDAVARRRAAHRPTTVSTTTTTGPSAVTTTASRP